MKQLIDETSAILDEYRNKRDKVGLDYNVFSLMGIERNELNTHEYMIFTILNYRTNSKLREEFVRLFLISMGLPKSFQNEKWMVEKEHFTENNGRIDLFFKTEGHSKKCVVVELKVDAGDQKKQLKRYEDYVLEKGYEDHRIIYLTLDGKEPSEQSYEGITNPRKLLLGRSFRKHLLEWLNNCIETCQEYDVDAGFIQQYKILIMKLVEEEVMEQDIVGLIKGSKELKACLGLVEALPIVKGQLLYDFMDEIHKEMQRKKCEFLYDNYECAKDYYDGRAHYPGFVCKITDFIVRNKKVTLALGIEVDYNLYFYFGYFDEQDKIINSEQFKNANKRINQSVEDAITNTLNCEIRSNSYNSIIFQYIVNSAGQKYDFKHFDENCAELKDTSVLKFEAKRIARNMMYYIKEVKAILEDEQ